MLRTVPVNVVIYGVMCFGTAFHLKIQRNGERTVSEATREKRERRGESLNNEEIGSQIIPEDNLNEESFL